MKNLANSSPEIIEKIFSDIIDQKIPTQDIKKILLEINESSFTSNIFLGSISALKKRMLKISAPEGAIDVCGTGGDKLKTLNISTAVCFVVAACGVYLAKHGNKAISSQSGSADIFQELKIVISAKASEIEENFRQNKICFLFAPFFHQSLKNLAEIRKEIAEEFGVPTIFNYLGPLLNPANTKIQLIGTSKKETMLPMLEALKSIGSKRVYVVHGFDGMDEVTLCDNSYLQKLENGKIYSEEIIDPQNFGFAKVTLESLQGKDSYYNAQKMIALFDGEISSYRNIVLLNSAFALKLSNKSKTIIEGIEIAKEAIDKGLVKALLLKIRSN